MVALFALQGEVRAVRCMAEREGQWGAGQPVRLVKVFL